jgi:hypothetical protein
MLSAMILSVAMLNVIMLRVVKTSRRAVANVIKLFTAVITLLSAKLSQIHREIRH